MGRTLITGPSPSVTEQEALRQEAARHVATKGKLGEGVTLKTKEATYTGKLSYTGLDLEFMIETAEPLKASGATKASAPKKAAKKAAPKKRASGK